MEETQKSEMDPSRHASVFLWGITQKPRPGWKRQRDSGTPGSKADPPIDLDGGTLIGVKEHH
ncbi:hypothetical protein PC119_g4704 [Phytophthora cactorum]|nr:hypothetical protein PC114_g21702 [Phytophthora cactorum]KAG3034929.1 hypothetical protein PC119_g4704 [Phytophthora cactorum]KAG3155531.1 hypothetical protein C6341_g15395 [Phytophthora cactorum]